MQRAEEVGLQLVEVNPKAQPPVCKIMDYGRFKYETSKRDREAKKNQKKLELKEVKYRPKTHDHDFEFKTRHARRFIDDGDKVKLVVQFRGREITHPETGRAILERVCKELADVAQVIQMAQMEGNRMNMVIGPKRTLGQKTSRPRPADADDDGDHDSDVDESEGDETIAEATPPPQKPVRTEAPPPAAD